MADTPQFLTLKENRDGRLQGELRLRRVFVGLLGLLALVALLDVLGQQPLTSTAAGGGARLEVSAPDRLRGGLFFQGRFTVRAEDEIESATLVLDHGWTESMHINTIEPTPVGEASRDGRLTLDFGHVPAGDRLIVWMQFQVNPTNVGRRSQDVELYDGETLLARADRTVVVFP